MALFAFEAKDALRFCMGYGVVALGLCGIAAMAMLYAGGCYFENRERRRGDGLLI